MKNEVQRYPGHPSTTCLSSVFFPGKSIHGDGGAALSENEVEAIYELAPKVDDGGSEMGTKESEKPIVFDRDRLYASVDDILFNIKRSPNKLVDLVPGGTGPHRASRGLSHNAQSCTGVEQSRSAAGCHVASACTGG